ncbi:MAG: ATP-binding protein [Granulosicoccus sp.]
MKLKYQLFITLLLASATLIAGLYAFNTWSFSRGFVNYITQSQTSALESLSNSLAEGYSENENWDWIRHEDDQWRRISALALRGSAKQGSRRDTGQNQAGAAELKRPKSGKGRDRSKHRPPQLVLVDKDKTVVAGRERPDRELSWFPINYDDAVVGYIGYIVSDGLPGQLESVFAEQQRRSLAWVSLLMVAISAILAAIIAPRIVKPVLTVSKAVSEISRGDFNQRVQINRRDELGDLSRDVNHLALTLEQSRTARRKWIAEISHELRTPVAILQGEIEAIEDGIRPFDSYTLGSLQSETLRLSRLISDLHDLSLSDLGALEYQMTPMRLQSLVEERTSSGGPHRAKKGISINLVANAADSEIIGDAQRLGQMLDNILQNSLRYTDDNGHIQISLQEQDEQLQILWNDSGPGLADEDLPQLFDPLFRAEQSRNRNNGGAGLGLAIVEKIVTAHRGSISASHSSLGGLQLEILIPLHDSPSSHS